MNIIGEKVILRAIELTDATLLYSIINDPETEKMLGGYSFPVSMNAQTNWILNQTAQKDVMRCIICDKNHLEDGVGTIILTDIDEKNGVAQIHIKLDSKTGRGKGYGTDSIKSMVKYAFEELRLNCIYAEVLANNIPSQKLFNKCGFIQDGILRARVYKSGAYINTITYSILRGESNI